TTFGSRALAVASAASAADATSMHRLASRGQLVGRGSRPSSTVLDADEFPAPNSLLPAAPQRLSRRLVRERRAAPVPVGTLPNCPRREEFPLNPGAGQLGIRFRRIVFIGSSRAS